MGAATGSTGSTESTDCTGSTGSAAGGACNKASALVTSCKRISSACLRCQPSNSADAAKAVCTCSDKAVSSCRPLVLRAARNCAAAADIALECPKATSFSSCCNISGTCKAMRLAWGASGLGLICTVTVRGALSPLVWRNWSAQAGTAGKARLASTAAAWVCCSAAAKASQTKGMCWVVCSTSMGYLGSTLCQCGSA